MLWMWGGFSSSKSTYTQLREERVSRSLLNRVWVCTSPSSRGQRQQAQACSAQRHSPWAALQCSAALGIVGTPRGHPCSDLLPGAASGMFPVRFLAS